MTLPEDLRLAAGVATEDGLAGNADMMNRAAERIQQLEKERAVARNAALLFANGYKDWDDIKHLFGEGD